MDGTGLVGFKAGEAERFRDRLRSDLEMQATVGAADVSFALWVDQALSWCRHGKDKRDFSAMLFEMNRIYAEEKARRFPEAT